MKLEIIKVIPNVRHNPSRTPGRFSADGKRVELSIQQPEPQLFSNIKYCGLVGGMILLSLPTVDQYGTVTALDCVVSLPRCSLPCGQLSAVISYY